MASLQLTNSPAYNQPTTFHQNISFRADFAATINRLETPWTNQPSLDIGLLSSDQDCCILQPGRFPTLKTHTHTHISQVATGHHCPYSLPNWSLPQKRVKMASPTQNASQSPRDTDAHQHPFHNQDRRHDRPHHAAQQQTHNPNQPMNYMPSVRAASEKKLGLLHFSSPQNHGWHGDVRKRYVTDSAA